MGTIAIPFRSTGGRRRIIPLPGSDAFDADHNRAHIGGCPQWRSGGSGSAAVGVGQLALGGAEVLLLVLRILGEEKLLARDLEGYQAYREKVQYRLVPHVW